MHSPRPLWLQSLIVFWAQAEEKIFISQSAASWVEGGRQTEKGGGEGERGKMHLQEQRANRFGVAVALRCISCVKLVYPQSACSLPSCSFAQQEAECLKLSSDSPATF